VNLPRAIVRPGASPPNLPEREDFADALLGGGPGTARTPELPGISGRNFATVKLAQAIARRGTPPPNLPEREDDLPDREDFADVSLGGAPATAWHRDFLELAEGLLQR
jgi:hypothetical protein